VTKHPLAVVQSCFFYFALVLAKKSNGSLDVGMVGSCTKREGPLVATANHMEFSMRILHKVTESCPSP